MKPILYNLFLLIFLSPVLAFSGNGFNGKHTREKKIRKEYEVPARGTLQIENSYGNVDISTWDEQRVVIQVFIKTNGDDLEYVEKKLNDIHVNFQQDASHLSATTVFEKEDRSWWSGLFGGGNNINMEINYVIKAPLYHNMNISNDYGAIYMDKVEGNTNISCDYGKIDIGELNGERNILNFDYTRNSHFTYIRSAEINADYSEYTIEEADRLAINADYTDSKIRKAGQVQFNCDYGSFQVDKVQSLEARGDYLSTKIGRVFSSIILDQDYGSINIDKLIKGVKSVRIDSDYAGIKLGYDAEMDFTFTIETSYGGVKGTNDMEVMKSHDGNTSKELSGFYGQKNSTNTLRISTSYGSVSFIKVP